MQLSDEQRAQGRAEVRERLRAELAKAREKYGETALDPGGHPELDVADYCLNELVGLIRYGRMIQARFHAHLVANPDPDPLDWDELGRRIVADRLVRVGRQIEARGRELATLLAVTRAQARELGLETGRTEHEDE